MPVIVNGSTGITTGTDTVTTITSPTATALTIQSAGTTAMTINTGLSVGIGTTTPSEKLDVAGAIRSSGSTNPYFVLSDGTNNGYMQLAGNVFNFYTAQSIPMTFSTAGSEKMRIDANGNVGIGTGSPGQKLDVVNTANSGVSIRVNSTNAGSSTSGAFILGNDVDSSVFYIQQNSSTNTTLGGGNSVNMFSKAGAMTFSTLSTERMRIDTSGYLLVGTTSTFDNVSSLKVQSLGGVATKIAGTALTSQMSFFNDNGRVGYIGTSGTTTSYNTSSDYRLKENIAPMTTGLATISALKPVTYDWISDKSAGEGFIAHEIQEIIPHAVSGEKDAVNEDGSIRSQGVDYSKIVVHLVAAIQELSAKNDALEAINAAFEVRLAALEAK